VTRAQEIIIEVNGMTCAHCERHVTDALSAVAGVLTVRSSHAEGRAVITADPSLATPEELRAAVREAGYEPGDVLYPE
jgi:copper chaperone CopZ